MPFPRPSAVCLIAALALASTAGMAFASQQRESGNTMTLGMAYPPPPYQAAKKFRTPEAIDMVLAQSVARNAGTALKTVPTNAPQGNQLLSQGKIDALIAPLSPSGAPDRDLLALPIGYAAKAMAIMRTDTTIKTAEQLRGRKVCVAEGSAYVGMLAALYGAKEVLAQAPADSLLAVRTGACDAAVHDSALLEELIKLPEWKKFSASMYLGPSVERALFIRRDDTKTANAAKKTISEWKQSNFLNQEIKRMVRHIAFEVYLDQDVPDCH